MISQVEAELRMPKWCSSASANSLLNLRHASSSGLCFFRCGFFRCDGVCNANRKRRRTRSFFAVTLFLPVLLTGRAHAAIFVDNAASSCADAATNYNPATRACSGSGGSDKVYLSLRAADVGVPEGTDSNRTVVNIRSGNYYEALIIHKNYTTWRKYPADATKPVIDGEWQRPNTYNGLFTTFSKTGITIDNVYFTRAGDTRAPLVPPDSHRYSGRHGLSFDNSTNCTVQNCDFVEIGDSGVALNNGGLGHSVKNNYFFENNLSASYHESWGGTVNIQDGASNIIVSGNKFLGCFGENVRMAGHSNGVTVEYNSFIDASRVAIFFSGSSNNTARYNLLYHTQSNSRYRCGGYGCHQIAIINEDGDNDGHKIYGNIVYGGEEAVEFGFDGNLHPEGRTKNTKIFNNIFMEANTSAIAPRLIWVMARTVGTGNEIKNNIFFQTSGAISKIEESGIAWGHNLWSKIPDVTARSTSDPTYASGYPVLNIADYFQKTSGWESLTADSLTGREFELRSTAVHAINAGAALGTPYNQLLNLSTSNFKTKVFNLVDQNSYGAWEIGAGVCLGSSGNTATPSGPTGLLLK